MPYTKAQIECREAHKKFERRYEVKKHVPDAIWDFPYIRPEPPSAPAKIHNYGKAKNERKFPYYTDEFVDKMEALAREDVLSEEYISFVEGEWSRRVKGFFFYNGNSLEYVTGHHYCTLQYWKIPVTKKVRGVSRKGRYKPDFIDMQRDIWYAIDYARKCDVSTGVCLVGFRRSGKTATALAEGYWDSTENPESVFAIQSKPGNDSKKQFKKLVDSWKLVPIWFKPKDTEETTQTTRLVFGEKKQKGRSIEDRVYQEVLNSVIYAENSKEEALDGEYVSFVFQDELGKSPRTLNVEERWNITKEALFDGSDVIGKAFLTSTVEDQNKYGSAHFKRIFDDSDPNKLLPNGLTNSTLFRLFLPAYYGFRGEEKNKKISFVDEWGYTNVKESKEYHQKMYDSKKGDSLLSYRRKYPMSINDCWITSDAKNNFSSQRLMEQKIWNDGVNSTEWVRGNFMWKQGRKWTEVDFYPDEQQGRWLVAWQPDEHDRNQWDLYNGTQKRPKRSFCFTGIDPFSHGKVVDDEQGSNGAAVTILKSYGGTDLKESVVCVYNYRQADPNAQIEDMIMQCVYYSSPALIESNVGFAINGFQDKGYYGFCEMNPLETRQEIIRKGKKGYATTSKESVENLISNVASYILDRVGKREDGECGYFPPQLVDQCLNFNPEKRGPYDLVMALGIAVILLRNEKQSTNIGWDFGDWVPRASVSTYERVKTGLKKSQIIG
jgi:hypothetical protein